MPPVPAGGPSTVNGVLYQLLYSLLTLGGFRVVGHRLSDDHLEQVTLLLEPSAGGDQQTLYAGQRVVTQLKAKSTSGSWSLQDVVRGVLPDLYRAVDEAQPETEYQFVTEGHRGRWMAVEELFRRMKPVPESEDVLGALDNRTEIRFGRARDDGSSDTFWEPGPYTAERLFRKVVDTLRERASVGAEPYEDTCRKTWHLLRGFRFIGGVTHQSLRAELDRWLLARVGSADRLAERRDHLLLTLARQACSGDAYVRAAEFLELAGLNGVPLTEWAILNRKAHDYLAGVLRRKRALLSDDARPKLTMELREGWTDRTPLLILTGDSGSGKTWHGYRALLAAVDDGDVALLVDSRADADRDLTEAANTFWHHVVGVDESPPLARLRARLKQIDPANRARRLTLLVDNVTSLDVARRLVETDWESYGVRLAMTCPPGVAEAIRPLIENRGRVVPVPDFSLPELRVYLTTAGVAWEDVPFDVTRTIRRPLLASLFGDLVTEEGWRPRHEYELYERAWASLRGRGVRPFDLDGLRRMAARVLLDGAGYPWTARDLSDNGLDGEAADRLVMAGWLRETTGSGYEVWHERLLNWTVAEAVACELAHESDGAEAARLETIAQLLREPRAACGRNLGYVPLDVLWIVSGEERSCPGLFSRFVAVCEAVLGWRASEVLLKELLPTLGGRATPLLLERLRVAADTGPSYHVNNIVDGLIATGNDSIPYRISEFLVSPEAKLRRAGVRLLVRQPSAAALDRLWATHVEGVQTPEPFLWEHEHRRSLYQDTFAALKACVPLDPMWIERVIEGADPDVVPVHDLAYLVSGLGNPDLWQRSKPALMAKVDAAHERALASCILAYRDTEQRDWLEARVDKMTDLVGPMALRALTAIAPRRALALLDRLDGSARYMTRSWWFPELHLRLPAEVSAHFAAALRAHDRPWRHALILQGREDLIDPESFDFLLDRLADQLAEAVAAKTPAENSTDCRTGLHFVNAVSRPELLDRLRRRRETPLENDLANWAIALGPVSGEWRVPDKFDALDALARIGGDGFNRVLDDWLERASWGGQLHAVEMAARRVTPRTVELLTELSATGGRGDEQHRMVLCGYAAAALATHRCWAPVARYYLRVGLASLTLVDECCPELDPPPDDATLGEALTQFHGESGPSPGSVLILALAGRKEILPEVRAALGRSEPESDLAAACLIALQWLGDDDSETVPAIARHLATHAQHATDALLANGTPAADQQLVAELRRRPDLQLAVIIANIPRLRGAGVEAICRQSSDTDRFRWVSGFTNMVAYLDADVLQELADCPEVFAFAENVAYGPYEAMCVLGEQPASLRLVGVRHPDVAFRLALSRLRNPDTPDGELYAPLVAAFDPVSAPAELLDIVRLDPPARVVRAIGRELGRLGGTVVVREWLAAHEAERRLAAFQVAGFLPPTEELDAAVRAGADDADRRVSGAAVAAHEHIRRARTAEELVRAIAAEDDIPHRWALLDALVSVADPGDGGTPPAWAMAIRPHLTPAMAGHLTKRHRERRKKLKEELDRADRDRR